MKFPEYWTKYPYFVVMRDKHEEYLNSPYKVIGVEERTFTTREDEKLTMDPETGQLYTMRAVSKDKKTIHDSLMFTKIFTDNLGQLMTLSPSSLKIMVYGICTVKPLSQVLILNPEDVCQSCGFSNSTFWNGVYELLNKKMICKKLGSNIEYWFDPNIFFNGNRLRIVKNSNNSSLNLLDDI